MKLCKEVKDIALHVYIMMRWWSEGSADGIYHVSYHSVSMINIVPDAQPFIGLRD